MVLRAWFQGRPLPGIRTRVLADLSSLGVAALLRGRRPDRRPHVLTADTKGDAPSCQHPLTTGAAHSRPCLPAPLLQAPGLSWGYLRDVCGGEDHFPLAWPRAARGPLTVGDQELIFEDVLCRTATCVLSSAETRKEGAAVSPFPQTALEICPLLPEQFPTSPRQGLSHCHSACVPATGAGSPGAGPGTSPSAQTVPILGQP